MRTNSILFRVQHRTRKAADYAACVLQRMKGQISGPTTPVFVLGMQRSGTRLPLTVLDSSPEAIVYSEGDSRAFDGMFLKPRAKIDALLRKSPFLITVLKPICESHRGPEFLDEYSGARIVWIFRHYADVANSAAVKFTDHHGNLSALARGDLAAAGWRAGGLSEERLALVHDLYRPSLSAENVHALMWFLRTSLFFELGLNTMERALLVRYESLVKEPRVAFSRMFDFLGCEFRPEFTDRVYATSISRSRPPSLEPEIEELCLGLESRLDRFLVSTASQSEPRSIVSPSPGARSVPLPRHAR
jgi:sulfotransferase family protein